MLSSLYNKKADEILTDFNDENGFSLVKPYPIKTQYYKDGRMIFIQVGLSENKLVYSVNMTIPKMSGEEYRYVITEGEKYKSKITNFYSDDEFYFDKERQKIIHTKKKKEFSVDEFIQILVNNHLTDRMYWKRKLNWSVNAVLKLLFWLVDKHYEHVEVFINKYHFNRNDDKVIIEEKTNIEPFFKYFKISKNLIFTTLLIFFVASIIFAFSPNLFFICKYWEYLFGDFKLSNPFVLLFLFLNLFILEKVSIWLDEKIDVFLHPSKDNFKKQDVSFIDKLHNFQNNNKFDLRLDVRK